MPIRFRPVKVERGGVRPAFDIRRALGPAALLAAFFTAVLAPPDRASAFPFFTRQIGRDCAFCHTLIPKLNETGRVFRSNGYRFAAEGEWRDVKDASNLPVSFEVEIEGLYDSVKKGGLREESSDLKIEEAEIMAGGAFGKDGKVSVLAVVGASQTDTGADVNISKAFVQVNDLAGPGGEGRLNLRAGQWELGLPFLTPAGSPVANGYLAESVLNIMTLEHRAVELNGLIEAGAEPLAHTHRYSLGLSREDVNGTSRLKGLYGTYSATINENLSFGAIYRSGREKDGAKDIVCNKYGGALEAGAGRFLFTLGLFQSDRAGTSDLTDLVGEVLYKPLKKLSFAARYDQLRQKGSRSAKSRSVMARYAILSNVYAQIEYRGLSDEGHIAGTNEDEDKLRAFFVAVF